MKNADIIKWQIMTGMDGFHLIARLCLSVLYLRDDRIGVKNITGNFPEYGPLLENKCWSLADKNDREKYQNLYADNALKHLRMHKIAESELMPDGVRRIYCPDARLFEDPIIQNLNPIIWDKTYFIDQKTGFFMDFITDRRSPNFTALREQFDKSARRSTSVILPAGMANDHIKNILKFAAAQASYRKRDISAFIASELKDRQK